MRGQDPRTSADFSDFEIPLLEGPENSQVIASKQTEQQDFRDRMDHEKQVARLRKLWESRRFLGRVAGAGLLFSALIAFLIPDRYQSVARLMPPDNQSGSGIAMAAAALAGGGGGGLGGLGGMAGDLLGQKSTSDLLAGVLGSQTVADKLIQEFDLKKVYHARRVEDTRRILEGWTDIAIDRKSQIITIKVTDKSPQRAAALAQAYVEELNHTLAAVSTSSARRERIFLEGRLHTVTQDLEASEKEFGQFASKNAAIDIKEQGKAMVTAAATLEGELIAARSELEGLRQLYTNNNVRVRSLQARIGELENQLTKVGGENESTPRDGASENDSLYPSIRELPLLGVPYADLYRKTRVQETLFEMLTQKYELAKVEEAKEIPTVKELDLPKVPEKKSFPPHLTLMLLGTILSFACGVTWLFGREKWERIDPSDPGKILAQEVFDTVKRTVPWASRNGHEPSTASRRAEGAIDRPVAEKEQHK